MDPWFYAPGFWFLKICLVALVLCGGLKDGIMRISDSRQEGKHISEPVSSWVEYKVFRLHQAQKPKTRHLPVTRPPVVTMYLVFKHAKKRYRERQGRRTEEQLSQATRSSAQDGTELDDTRVLTASPSEHNPLRLDGPSVHVMPNSSSKDKPKPTPEDLAEKKRRHKYRLKIIFGLFLPFTLQALDTTIIASALKFIADDFSQCPFSSSLSDRQSLHLH